MRSNVILRLPVVLALLGSACATAPSAPARSAPARSAPLVDESLGGQLVCRKGNETLRLEVPAGHLAEVRELADKMGFSASDCRLLSR